MTAAADVTEQAQEIFGLTGGRWTVPVIRSLIGRRLRFGAVKRELGTVSQKQLTHTLRELERDGFVERTAYMTIPPRVEYELTEMGSALADHLLRVGRFAVERWTEIETARQRFDAASARRSEPETIY